MPDNWRLRDATTTVTSTGAALNPNPTTPAFNSNAEWIAAYITIHEMSDPSYRYAYLLWVTIVFGFLVFGVLHWTGSRGGFIGAYWSKWALRRRTWRKKHALALARRRGERHKQPLSLPSNAQILCLSLLLLSSIALSSLGPDYIAPSTKLWDFIDGNSTSVWRRAAATTPSTVDLTVLQPQFTIHKEWWTAANRTGLLAFALFPLCILFALKSPPFAVFAIPFMIQMFYDKLYGLHRWCGRIIWLITAFHVAFWVVQLAKDINVGTGQIGLLYVWSFPRFIFGCTAFVLLTLLMLLSLRPVRSSHYTFFYAMHLLLVPATLVMSALHHPQVGEWCWAALALWIGERFWRGTWWLHINGFFGGMSRSPIQSPPYSNSLLQTRYSDPRPLNRRPEAWEMKGLRSPYDAEHGPLHSNSPYVHSPLTAPNSEPHHNPSNSSVTYKHSSSPSNHFRLREDNISSAPSRRLSEYIPPPGYAHAELLSGRTVRLRIIPPGFVSWAPGQHFLISIPYISHLTSHPFTVASVCDEDGPDQARQLVFIIRCKSGWTKTLWDSIASLMGQSKSCPPHDEASLRDRLPTKGVLFRAFVDGPFGSSIRARWSSHSTAVIVVGGAGVSFGAGLLEYLCLCLAGRDGKSLGGRPGGWGWGMDSFKMRRVRFIWLVREFAHIQWCATLISRCMEMVPAPGLQIDIYVTNFKPGIVPSITPHTPRMPVGFNPGGDAELFVPPTPHFAQEPRRRQHNGRSDSIDSDIDQAESDVDLSYYFAPADSRAQRVDWSSELGHETDILDLTNFDGDNDAAIAGEDQLNKKVKQEGKLRRAHTRRIRGQGRPKSKRDGKAELHDVTTPSQYPPTSATSPRRTHHSSTDQLLHWTSPPPNEDSHQTPILHPPYLELDITSPLAHNPYESEPANLRAGGSTFSPRKGVPPRLQLTDHPSMPTVHSPGTPTSGYSAPRPHSRLSVMSAVTMAGSESIHNLLSSGMEVRLEPDEHEIHAINVVAEHARPGKPKLNAILAEEVEDSQGSVIVACCGPTSLNAVMRKAISQQIDPARIRRGDMRGSIALVSEEFHF